MLPPSKTIAALAEVRRDRQSRFQLPTPGIDLVLALAAQEAEPEPPEPSELLLLHEALDAVLRRWSAQADQADGPRTPGVS